jgi:hypothetical protein
MGVPRYGLLGFFRPDLRDISRLMCCELLQPIAGAAVVEAFGDKRR